MKVLTNGCFDLLHRGHVESLNYIKRTYPGELIVLLNSDSSVSSIKGSSRPVISQDDRKYMLESLKSVDKVIIFDDVNISKLIDIIKPDIYVKSQDYTFDTLNAEERDALIRNNVLIRFGPLVSGYSTSNTISRIKELY